MVHINAPSLFHKKSKSTGSSKPSETEERKHARKWSSSSTLSRASSCASSVRQAARISRGSATIDGFNPLSLHPPLRLNTSPHLVIPEYDMARYEEDEERESRFFNQTRHAEDHIQDMAEYSPVKGENCYFDGSATKPYTHAHTHTHTHTHTHSRASSSNSSSYEQDSQWPLKDWQTIPPGLSSDSSSAASSPTSSIAASPRQPDMPRRRNADWMNDTDVFVKRGPWKRQGVVFELNERDEDFQEQHFQLPE